MEQKRFSPPYIPFRTLLNLLDRMNEQGIPGRVDRGWLSSLSGQAQTHLLTALRSLALIDENGSVSTELRTLAENPDNRHSGIADLLRRFYAGPLHVAESNGTQMQLSEAFDAFKLSSETKRKAIAFFLQAAEFSKLPLSRHIRVPRTRAGRRPQSGTRGRRSTRGNEGGAGGHGAGAPPPTSPQSDVAEKLLAKMPEFDPNWSADVQVKWFEAMERLQEILRPKENGG